MDYLQENGRSVHRTNLKRLYRMIPSNPSNINRCYVRRLCIASDNSIIVKQTIKIN